MAKTPDEIKRGLVEAIEEASWVVEGGDAHDLIDACEKAHASMADALACIQQLESQVPKWISVKERLPEHEVRVQLGCSRMQYVDQGYLDSEEMDWYDAYDNRVARPTHWMPLPEPPKEE